MITETASSLLFAKASIERAWPAGASVVDDRLARAEPT
jgi:hypothetical protein